MDHWPVTLVHILWFKILFMDLQNCSYWPFRVENTSNKLSYFYLNVSELNVFQGQFSTSFYSCVKVGVMMIGELEYADLFHDADIPYEGLTYAIFIIFLCVVTIIIMNLLVCRFSMAQFVIFQLNEF